MAFAVLLAFGVGLAGWAVYAGWGRDFESFYWSAVALSAGENPYEPVVEGAATNLNLPHVTLLLVPFTLLPFSAAFALWQVVQLSAWGGLLRSIAAGVHRLTPEFAAMAILFPGTLARSHRASSVSCSPGW